MRRPYEAFFGIANPSRAVGERDAANKRIEHDVSNAAPLRSAALLTLLILSLGAIYEPTFIQKFASLYMLEVMMDTVFKIAQITLLFVTAGLLVWYTIETYRLRKVAVEQADTANQSHLFSALTTIHKQLSNVEQRNLRHYIYNTFPKDLATAVEIVFDNTYVSEDSEGNKCINVKKLLGVRADSTKLKALNQNLEEKRISTCENYSSLRAVESVLTEFDIIALPIDNNVKSAIGAAKAWKRVLSETAKSILPFVILQKRLRGDDYKSHYLNMLRSLDIDLMGI